MGFDVARLHGFVIGSYKDLSYENAMSNADNPQNKPQASQKEAMALFLRAFLVPTLVTKALIIYFGLQYAEYPDEGYGYGLIISIGIMVVNFGLFLYKANKFHFD